MIFAVAKLNEDFYMARSCNEETYEIVKNSIEEDAKNIGIGIAVEKMTEEEYETYSGQTVS